MSPQHEQPDRRLVAFVTVIGGGFVLIMVVVVIIKLVRWVLQ